MMDDNSAVSIREVAAKMIPPGNELAAVAEFVGDHLASAVVATGEAESLDFCGGEAVTREVEEELGHGKRKRKANMLYSHRFWLSHED
ncbi:hypothetical protein J3R83DRAFT_13130 [Lanmaoa asiatica]|nr:hypothetical protein J3R83DRAFT_13130 [Lanmaoa asiatica]